MVADIIMKDTNQVVRYSHDEFIKHNEVERVDNCGEEESAEKEARSSR